MSDSGGTAIQTQLRAVQEHFQRRQTRLFVTFAMVEAAAMAVTMFAIFAFEAIDFEIGVWILVGIAAIGGFVMSMALVNLAKARALAINQTHAAATPI